MAQQEVYLAGSIWHDELSGPTGSNSETEINWQGSNQGRFLTGIYASAPLSS